jgi:hypothetical protein
MLTPLCQKKDRIFIVDISFYSAFWTCERSSAISTSLTIGADKKMHFEDVLLMTLNVRIYMTLTSDILIECSSLLEIQFV